MGDMRLSTVLEWLPPGGAKQQDVQPGATYYIFVLLGELTVLTRGGNLHLSREEGAEIRLDEPHVLRNDGTAEASVLMVAAPGY